MKFNLIMKPGEELISTFEASVIDSEHIEAENDYDEDFENDCESESGALCITNQRIVFNTETKNKTIKLSTITAIMHDEETITISPENGDSICFDTWKTSPESVQNQIMAIISEQEVPKLLPNEIRIQQIARQREIQQRELQIMRDRVAYETKNVESRLKEKKSILGFAKSLFK